MIRALVNWWFGIFPLATCSNCRYWQAGIDDKGEWSAQGTCRREGPRVVTFSGPPSLIGGGRSAASAPTTLNVQSYWPPVTPSEWCGRHERRWT